jgi:hypothetical protein
MRFLSAVQQNTGVGARKGTLYAQRLIINALSRLKNHRCAAHSKRISLLQPALFSLRTPVVRDESIFIRAGEQ